MTAPPGPASRWARHGGPLVAALVAGAGAGIPVAVGLLTADQVKTWHWPLGASAAILAAAAAYFTTRATQRAERTTTQALRDTKQTAVEARDIAERATRDLLQQVSTAEAQRASTATAMTAVGAALVGVVHSGDANSVSVFKMTLAAILRNVLPESAKPFRVAFLARRDATDKTALSKEFADGVQMEVKWEIARGSKDADIADVFAGPPWEGALLIDDVTAPEYRRVGMLVLQAPDSGVLSYCRAEVRYADHQFGLLCVDSWSATSLTETDKRVVEAFAAMLAIGLALAAGVT